LTLNIILCGFVRVGGMVVKLGGARAHVLKCFVLWFKFFELSFIGEFSSELGGGKRKTSRGPCNMRSKLHVCVSAQAYVCACFWLNVCCMCRGITYVINVVFCLG